MKKRSLLLNNLGLYIHIPWCIKKCPYCDFNSHTFDSEVSEQHYIDALLSDLQNSVKLLDTPREISSIFIGGGTPSLFSAEFYDNLLTSISTTISFQNQLEITLEANPGTFESEKFKDYRKIGINRLSIGIQSFNDNHLKKLGRVHSSKEALAAIEIAHQAGFDNLNLDLMFGLPEQTTQEMLSDVQIAIDHEPSHISFYQLTLEPNTYFHKFPPKLPQDDLIYSSQKKCQQLLDNHGYHQYEISAYAKKNSQCHHNLNYWQFGASLGIGAGAHGKVSQLHSRKIIRTVKKKKPDQYILNNTATITPIDQQSLTVEFLINQLRLKSGFTLAHFQLMTGLSLKALEPNLSICIEKGLIIKHNQHYCCSKKGWDFLDDILEMFIPDSL